MPLVSDYPRRRLSAIVEGNAHPSRPQGWRGAGGDLRHWAGQVVEKVRVASVGGRLRFLPWFDPYTDESPEMRAEYRVMLRESSVKAAFQTKVLGVIAEEVQFQADNDDDPREQEGVEFCQYQFRKFRGGAQAVGFSILSGAIIDGHSVCEKVWCPEPIPTGKFRGKRIYHAIKAKDTRYVQLGIDPYRNVTALRGTGFNAGRVWSPSDFVIFSYFSLFENPAGLSDFRAAYRPYWVKDTSWKLRALSLEKWSGPFITGQYTSQEQKEALEAAFDEAKASTWLTVPSGVVVECLDLAMKGTGDFKDAIADCDREILIAIVGAHLQILEGQTGGARGNTKVHKEIGELIQWWLSVTLADVYREQIVVPLMAENYHGVEPPTVTLGAVTDEAMLERGKVYESLQKMGLALSKKAIYRTFNVQPPDPDDKDDLLQPPGQGGPGGGPGGPPQPPGGPAGGGGGQALSERGGWADRRPFAGGADCWPWGFSEAGWYAFASANAGRKVGEKWQGPSGRWFTKRQDNRIVPTSSPQQDQERAARKQQREQAAAGRAKASQDAAARKDAAAKAYAGHKERAKDLLARLKAIDPNAPALDTAPMVRDLVASLRELSVKDIQALAAAHGITAGGAKDVRAQRIAARAAGAPARAKPKGTPAKPAGAAPWEGGTPPEPGKVYNAPTGALLVDPGRFQFKLNVNQSGVTDELSQVKTFNPDFAGVVSVWQDPEDGKTYVVNGHHRHELATRTGHPNLAVRYITAPDAKTARAVGALVNMAEGRGTAVDAAKWMRDSGKSPADLEAVGVSLRGKLAQDATALTHLNDRLFDRVARGLIPIDKALAVAKHLHNPDLQDQLFRLLDAREEAGKDLSPKVIEEMAREMAETPTTTTDGGDDLFGSIQSEESLFVPRNEIKVHVRGEMAREVNDFLAVASKRRAGRVAGAGNVLDVEENRRIAQEADRVKNVFDKLVNRRGPISDALNDAAAKLAKAKTKGERDAIKRQAVAAVRDAVFAEAGVGTQPGGVAAGGTGGGAAGTAQ